jgi:hypothetical protein
MDDAKLAGAGLSRRTFIRAAAGTGVGFVLYAYLPGGEKVALAEVPGGTLSPSDVPQFVTPMLIPPVMPRAGTIAMPGGKPADYYEISMRQFRQQILPTGLPSTTVWGYGAVSARTKRGLRVHHAPSLTIEARHGTVVRSASGGSTSSWTARAGISRTCCRWIPPCTGRTLREVRPLETPDRRSGRRPDGMSARSPW